MLFKTAPILPGDLSEPRYPDLNFGSLDNAKVSIHNPMHKVLDKIGVGDDKSHPAHINLIGFRGCFEGNGQRGLC